MTGGHKLKNRNHNRRLYKTHCVGEPTPGVASARRLQRSRNFDTKNCRSEAYLYNNR